MTIYFSRRYEISNAKEPVNQAICERYQYKARPDQLQSNDIIYLLKLPSGAKMVELRAVHSGDPIINVDYGLAYGHRNGGASYSCLISNRINENLDPISPTLLFDSTVSLSTNDTLGYGILAAKIVGGDSCSSTLTFTGTAIYAIDTLD